VSEEKFQEKLNVSLLIIINMKIEDLTFINRNKNRRSVTSRLYVNVTF